MYKRVISLFLVIVLATLIPGCSLGKKNTGYEPLINGEKLKNVTLTFYVPGDTHVRLGEILKQVGNKAKDALNVNLDIQSIQGLIDNKVAADINSNVPFDAFVTQDLYMRNFMSKGYLKDMTKIFPRYAPQYYNKFTPDQLKTVTFDGKVMAIPSNNLSTTNRVYAVVRDDLMKKYGITQMSNYNDFETYMKTVKNGEPGITPAMMYGNSLKLFAGISGYAIFESYIGLVYRWDDPQMKVMAWEQTPEYKNALDTLNRWKTNGYVNDGFSSEPFYADYDITAGKNASFLGTKGLADKFNDILKKNGDVKWRYKEYELYPEIKAQITDSMQMNALSFVNKSPNVERAVMFIEWLQSDQENYDLFMYGVKGKDYVLKNNKISLPSNTTLEEAYMSWNGKNAFYNYLNAHLGADYIKSYTKSINKNSSYPPLLGYHYDERSFLSAVKASETIGRDAFYPERLIDAGNYSWGAVDSFISSQKATVKVMTDYLQNEIDAWKANQGK